jgi:DNA-binding CsgD family transcriptional regulator
MFPYKNSIRAGIESKTYPLVEQTEPPSSVIAAALVALSHSPVEHRLYLAMRTADNNSSVAFTARNLESLTGIHSLSTIRRGLDGLLAKLSIEKKDIPVADGPGGARGARTSYIAFAAEQIIARRRELGICTYENGFTRNGNHLFERAFARVAENGFLSRREVQVALCCVEGLTNAEIGTRLEMSERTVKFHLRHIFVKFGVKRRAELISRLLM